MTGDGHELTRGSYVRTVVHHVVRCASCQRTVRTLSDGREAATLLRGQANVSPATTLERVMQQAQVVGHEVLAGLVYELAKALFFEDEVFARFVGTVVAPRSTTDVAQELSALSPRAAALGFPVDFPCVDADEMVLATPTRRRELADQLTLCLRSLEGESPRFRLLTSNAAISDGRPEEAITSLEHVLNDDSLSKRMRALAADSLARCLVRLDRFSQLDTLLTHCRESGLSTPIQVLYGAAADLFHDRREAALEKLKNLPSHQWWEADEVDRAKVLVGYIEKHLGRGVLPLSSEVGGQR